MSDDTRPVSGRGLAWIVGLALAGFAYLLAEHYAGPAAASHLGGEIVGDGVALAVVLTVARSFVRWIRRH